MERTVVLVKPDGVRRRLVGEVVSRFERMGLKIVAMKMIWAKGDHLGKHYKNDQEYLKTLGNKTLQTYEEYGKDAPEDLGTNSAAYANAEKRGVENIVHVSGSVEEAKFEEKLWFHKSEIQGYKHAD